MIGKVITTGVLIPIHVVVAILAVPYIWLAQEEKEDFIKRPLASIPELIRRIWT